VTSIKRISAQLKDTCAITYIDADHSAAEPLSYANLSDKISYDSMDFVRSLNDYDRKVLLNDADMLLINGNHFLAKLQIVFCTEKKKASLERKLDRLTDVRLIILDNGISEPHPYLKSALKEIDKIPVISIDDETLIAEAVKKIYEEHIPAVKGLVLAGGKSQRMGSDKAFLDYHGMPQVEYAAQQMTLLGIEPYISCRAEQEDHFSDRYARVYDTFMGLGPYGALLSAFRSDPDSAWLVTACDQPLLQGAHLKLLLEGRDTAKIATCFHNPDTGFPEPLITLWEPRAYPRLLSFLSLGYSCPRKVLINSDIYEIHLEDTAFMANANTPEERMLILNPKS